MFRTIVGTSIATALLAACLPALAAEGTIDGFPPAQNLDYTHLPGADQETDGTTGISGGSAYLFIAGSAFTPRTSAQAVTYPGGGCLYSTGALTTSLELPNNAVIEGVRLYYYSTDPADTIGMFLTNYPGNGTSTDLRQGTSTSGGGYIDEYYDLDPSAVVNNAGSSYVLTATMAPNTRFCGMRVFYSP